MEVHPSLVNERIDQRSLNELCNRGIPEESDEERKGSEEDKKSDNHSMTKHIRAYKGPERKVSIS